MEKDLINGAKNCIVNFCRLKEGEEVTIIRDGDTDEEVVQALKAMAYEVGAKYVTVLSLDTPLSKEPHVQREYWVGEWPKVYEGILAKTDVLIRTVSKASHHNPNFPKGEDLHKFMEKHKARYVRFYAFRKEILGSEYATFPRELLSAINQKAAEPARMGNRIQVTDPNGTNITFEYDNKRIFGTEKLDSKYFCSFQAGMVGVYPKHANGIIVSDYTHQGPIRTIRLEVKDNQVVKVEGGGAWGRSMLKAFEKYREVNHGFHPGPGANWLEECMWGCHPKARMFLPSGEWSYIGSRGAGPVHLAVGDGYSRAKSLDPRFPNMLDQHRDQELYHNTIQIDGNKVIEDGRLLVLDDPEIKEIASKYGDPDQLLETAEG